MKELSDEILNKYIDNELSSSEVNELKEFISNNPDELKKFKAHKLIDEILRGLEHESSPPNFTAKVMERINSVNSYKLSDNKFIKVISSIFGALILGFLVAGISLGTSQKLEPSSVSEGINKSFEAVGQFITSLNISLSNDTFLVVVSAFSLIVLVSIYIFINSHKTFKQKLENLSH